ncbi:ABC transporter substrate-binding protein [Pelagibacterium lacus]|nr:ABC transporter substrate-binding protein [Pelagibacterium lacus]
MIHRRNLLIATAFAALLGIGNSAYAQQDPIRVGVLVGTSGASGQIGNWTNRGVEIAIEELNEAAGFQRFSMFSEDSEYKAQKGLEGFNKLTNVDGIDVLITSGSAVLPTIAPLADQRELVMMNVGAQSPAMAGIGKFTFSVIQLADFDIAVMANYAFDTLDFQRGAALYISNDIGQTNVVEFERQFTQLGGEMVAIESFRASDTNYGPQVAKIAAAQPDFVYLVGDVDVAAAATRQIKALMPNVQILTYGGMESQLFLDAAGAAAEGLLYTQTDFDPSSDDPAIAAVAQRYQTRYGEDFTSPFIGYAYDAMMVVAAALDAAGETGEPLRAAIMDRRDFPGITGDVVFRDDGTVSKSVIIKGVRDGAFVLVDRVGASE